MDNKSFFRKVTLSLLLVYYFTLVILFIVNELSGHA